MPLTYAPDTSPSATTVSLANTFLGLMSTPVTASPPVPPPPPPPVPSRPLSPFGISNSRMGAKGVPTLRTLAFDPAATVLVLPTRKAVPMITGESGNDHILLHTCG